ncbi:DUF2637 domain-containing protein [Streptomyces sp. NBC_01381]|uniref:DUF2637 domain-containing protein n=1 Tax=Streptomyces sp. NBC_01381 TaxID=2903845 RepID=UPI0022583164|nr:DUF2637 domain-containing protein [Streptomyces sp. NBC_01381]MCX4673639.1 DUF2637 domain-containing protein [Streptomyces sp. NBC_01381]
MAEGNGRAAILLTRTHRILIGVVVAGAVVIAGIGFAGSYAAVRELAEKKGFGSFSVVFPIGIDAGICVLLALDLLLTWIRIPFPLLRQTAWLLTAATIAFNGAAAWPDPLGVGMHAVIPILFVVAVEAARHAVGRIADITADKHMEGVRLTRWLLSPVPTFKLWRRMKLWEIRSYEQVIQLEQDRLIYQARLQARFGRSWRRKAPVESLMPLRLARFGVPLAETAPAGLAAAGIEPTRRSPSGRAETPTAVTAPEVEREQLQAPEQQPAKAGVGEASLPEPLPLQATTHESYVAVTPVDDAELEGYGEAFRAYVSQYGVAPTGHQFGYYLMDTYGVAGTDGRPFSDGELRPLLQILREREVGAGLVAEEQSASGPDTSPAPMGAMAATAVATAAAEPHAFFGAPSAEPSRSPEPVATSLPVATAESSALRMAGGNAEAAPASAGAAEESASAPSDGETDLAVAGQLALQPEPSPEEAETVPEDDRVRAAVELLRAEPTMSGAAIGRKLNLSERTARRVAGQARAFIDEQERATYRPLQSVPNQR